MKEREEGEEEEEAHGFRLSAPVRRQAVGRVQGWRVVVRSSVFFSQARRRKRRDGAEVAARAQAFDLCAPGVEEEEEREGGEGREEGEEETEEEEKEADEIDGKLRRKVDRSNESKARRLTRTEADLKTFKYDNNK